MKKYLILLLSYMFWSASINAQIHFGNQQVIGSNQYNASTVVAADLDNDGDNDVISGSLGTDNTPGHWPVLCTYKNEGDYLFDSIDTLYKYEKIYDVKTGDISGQGNSDIVFTVHDTDNSLLLLLYLKNDGAGNFTDDYDTVFSCSTTVTNAPVYMPIQITDMDNDNDEDILVAFNDRNTLSWFENNGTGTQWTEHLILNNVSYYDIAVGDLDNDNDLDIACADFLGTKTLWLQNNNDGTWTGQSLVHITNDRPYTVALADLNNDNYLDIVYGTSQIIDSARVFWYENQKNGSFSSPKSILAIKNPSIPPNYLFSDVEASDLDLDGDMDVIAASNDGKIQSFSNSGNGSFESGRTITNSVSGTISIFAADLDNLADIDLLSASTDDNKIACYDNLTPIILEQAQTPQSACVGTDSVMFAIKAINAATYQWRRDGSYIYDNSLYKGTDTDTLYVNAEYLSMDGSRFDCIITGSNPFPKDTSDVAILNVDEKIQANAGNDQRVCEASSVSLSANNPSPHSGYWSSNTGSINFENSSAYNTEARNLPSGEIELYWTIDNKSCGNSVDTVIIKNYQNATANAGDDKGVCDTSKVQLHANTLPDLSVGTWTCNRSGVIFDNANKPDAIASNLPENTAGSVSVFTWTVNNGQCGSDADEVRITNHKTIIANAGDDKKLCDENQTSLSGNNPDPYSGYWKVSNTQVVFDNSAYYNTTASNIRHGQTIFTWTIDIPVCGSNSDEVVVSSYTSAHIDEQPADLTVTEGEQAQFSIKVSGDVQSYQWFKDNLQINDDTRISGSGTENLIITNSRQNDAGTYKCVFIDYCYEQEHTSGQAHLTVNASSTGFDELKNSGISIYPNPNNGIFNITNSNEKIQSIKILNTQGSVIYQKDKPGDNIIPVNISDYSKGIYILSINKNKKQLHYKIVVQ